MRLAVAVGLVLAVSVCAHGQTVTDSVNEWTSHRNAYAESGESIVSSWLVPALVAAGGLRVLYAFRRNGR